MKFIVFVEGHTEDHVIAKFLKQWLDPKLSAPVGIKILRHEGLSDYSRGIKDKVHLNLAGQKARDVIAAIGLLDLYGPSFYPDHLRAPEERYSWAKNHLEQQVGHPRFRQHFAVHETEAWLLAHPEILPSEVRRALPGKAARPETVNFDEPPAKLLNRLYRERLGRNYRKVLDGAVLFRSLSPDRAYEKCPYLKLLLDDMLTLAQEALR